MANRLGYSSLEGCLFRVDDPEAEQWVPPWHPEVVGGLLEEASDDLGSRVVDGIPVG